MNSNIVKGKWTEVKGELLTTWGKLTSDELDETKGNLLSIAGLINQRYGEAKELISEKLHTMFSDAKEDAGRAAADKTDEVKQDVRATEIPRGTSN